MKREQKQIAENDTAIFGRIVNDHLRDGWRIVPATTAVAGVGSFGKILTCTLEREITEK